MKHTGDLIIFLLEENYYLFNFLNKYLLNTNLLPITPLHNTLKTWQKNKYLLSHTVFECQDISGMTQVIQGLTEAEGSTSKIEHSTWLLAGGLGSSQTVHRRPHYAVPFPPKPSQRLLASLTNGVIFPFLQGSSAKAAVLFSQLVSSCRGLSQRLLLLFVASLSLLTLAGYILKI